MTFKWHWQHPLYYIPLVFMVFPFGGIYFFGYPLWTLPFSLLFLLAYLIIVHEEISWLTNFLWVYMLLYITFMTLTVNSGMIWFYFYLNNLYVYRLQDDFKSFRFISYVVSTIFVILYVFIKVHDIAVQTFTLLIPILNFAMLIFWTLERKRDEAKELLMEKNKSINLLLAENERNRIGQDLHDTLGHVFVMLTVKADLIQTLLDHGEIAKAQKEVADLQKITKNATSDVRQMVESLKDHNISEELVVISNMLELAGIDLQVKGAEVAETFPLAIQSKLSMIIRELINNLMKHSQAKACQLAFGQTKSDYLLNYQDDGIGFSNLTGQELHSIKDRLVPLRGELVISSAKNPTQISIRIPVKE
ncbi:histidine kinase [Streptococcus penaeicida]|uniref:histidine kinase n=1 Tax=Streptococcus penaeicida TaxID=1765960 RepID=A0A2N8LAS1_9STRE|nr:sensor histidine kinase [Streptococcus penaeicida]PND47259.1 histidine kinase [Streptococcus penaeicida]